jgi:hypothetical protein
VVQLESRHQPYGVEHRVGYVVQGSGCSDSVNNKKGDFGLPF